MSELHCPTCFAQFPEHVAAIHAGINKHGKRDGFDHFECNRCGAKFEAKDAVIVPTIRVESK